MLLLILLSPNLKSHSLVFVIRLTMKFLLFIMNPLLKPFAFLETNAFFSRNGYFPKCMHFAATKGRFYWFFVYVPLITSSTTLACCLTRLSFVVIFVSAFASYLLMYFTFSFECCSLSFIYCYNTCMVFQLLHRDLLWHPQKEELKKRSHQKNSGNNLLEYDFCLVLVHEVAFQKNLCNKENLLLNWSFYTLKFSFSIWLSKFWFHFILHLMIRQQKCNNERKFFFNKQTINYKKRQLSS